MAFLAEDRECVEFQWLYDAIARRILENRIEWELSLYEAMKRLGYSIQADQRRFMLCVVRDAGAILVRTVSGIRNGP